MPGRKPPRRGEIGNGFMAPPRGAVERRRRTSPSSTTAASVVRSLVACARAWASNSSRMSTVAFTIIIVPRISPRPTPFSTVVAAGRRSPRRVASPRTHRQLAGASLSPEHPAPNSSAAPRHPDSTARGTGWWTHGPPPRALGPPDVGRSRRPRTARLERRAWAPGSAGGWRRGTRHPRRIRVIDSPIAGPLLSNTMSVIAQAIADRQTEIDRLQAEIKALTDVEQILGAAAPEARPKSRRSSSPRKAAAAAPESKAEAKPERKRREMSAAEKKAVSERMTAYWAERRKKAAKK